MFYMEGYFYRNVLSRSVVSDSFRPHGPTSLLCSWGFSRQEYWSGLPCPPPGDLLNPGIKPRSPTLQADSLLSEPPWEVAVLLAKIQSLATAYWHGRPTMWISCVPKEKSYFFVFRILYLFYFSKLFNFILEYRWGSRVLSCSVVSNLCNPMTVPHQTPLSLKFSRHE